MKRAACVILAIALLASPGCAVWYLSILADKCARGGMKEGEVAAGNTQVRVVCKDGKLERHKP